MTHGNYGSGREPVLTELERVALYVSQQGRWAEDQRTDTDKRDDKAGSPRRYGEWSVGYLAGFSNAMLATGKEIERTKDKCDGARPLTGDAFHWALYQLRLVEIELGGWIERADLPGDMAKDMSERMQRIMEATKANR